jgi:Ca2+-binding RTX toxin-like protein
MSILLLWDESGRPITNGAQITIWEGESFSFSAFYNSDRGGSVSILTDNNSEFVGIPSPFNSTNSTGRTAFVLRSKNNSVRDGDRIVNLIASNDRTGTSVNFSLLIMDDDFGNSRSPSSSLANSSSKNSTPSSSGSQSITGDGNTVINGNGNTVNINKTINKNTTNNINNGTINNNIINFNIGSISVDLSNAIQGDTRKRDNVTGTDGNDVLASGLGRDILTGNGGSDTFVLSEMSRLGKKGANTISDFDSSEGDKLVIDPEMFDGESLAIATSNKEVKQLASTDADFIYSSTNGRLFYDSNGDKKGFGSGGMLAILKGAPELTRSDLGLLA